jgi:hypothetical protein
MFSLVIQLPANIRSKINREALPRHFCNALNKYHSIGLTLLL